MGKVPMLPVHHQKPLPSPESLVPCALAQLFLGLTTVPGTQCKTVWWKNPGCNLLAFYGGSRITWDISLTELSAHVHNGRPRELWQLEEYWSFLYCSIYWGDCNLEQDPRQDGLGLLSSWVYPRPSSNSVFFSLFNEVLSITIIFTSSGPTSLWQEQSLRSTSSRKSHLSSSW